MDRAKLLKLVLAGALLGTAAFLFARFLRKGDGVSEQTYFYDLSEKKLFAASREALPPIRGLNDAEEDAVRAVVVSVGGDPKSEDNRRIAYLEKYAPEFKQQLEKVRAGQADPLPRGSRNGLRFVRRINETEWHALNTPEGEKILTEWNVPGSDGKFPIVCSP